MPKRYARLDVDFFHKRTARALRDRFGVAGPALFVALILRAKDGSPPGTFTYTTDAVAWEKLGFDGVDLGFTLDDFFTMLGRLKQSSRRRVGPVTNVYLTRYADWQKDSRRYEEAVRKSSKRRETTADTKRTQHGTRSGHKVGPRSRTTSTPLPPIEKNGQTYPCTICGASQRTKAELEDHLEYVHEIRPEQLEPPILADDDIPF